MHSILRQCKWKFLATVSNAPEQIKISPNKDAHLHVDMDSSMFLFSTEHVAIIVVIQFPPKLSLNTDVIMEFR